MHGHCCLSKDGVPTVLQDCLALGAIFATTDSVAVLQVLEQDRAPLLFSLVFGEGVINDATTVALLRTVQVRGADDVSLTAGGLPKLCSCRRSEHAASQHLCACVCVCVAAMRSTARCGADL